MNTKSSKAGIIATLVIYFTLIALLSVCTFAIPFPKLDNGVLITAYVCSVAMIIIEGTLTLTILFKEEEGNQRILGLPIVYYGYIALLIQIIATVIFYICNAFVVMPIWIIIIVECVIYAFLTIQIVKGFFFAKRNVEYHTNISNTKFMDEFRARLKAIVSINKNENIAKVLENFLDDARASDPVSNEKTLDSESELLSLLQELDESVKEGSEEAARDVLIRMKNTLLERNALCKLGK